MGFLWFSWLWCGFGGWFLGFLGCPYSKGTSWGLRFGSVAQRLNAGGGYWCQLEWLKYVEIWSTLEGVGRLRLEVEGCREL